MSDAMIRQRIGMIVTIVDYGQGEHVARLYRTEQNNMIFQYKCHASGTAGSEILDYLGLVQTEKDVVISLLTYNSIPELLKRVNEKLNLSRPGKGIAFSLRLNALSSYVSQQLHEQQNCEEGEELVMDKEAKYELVIAVVNHGYAEKTMDAANEAGATGGTVLQARLLGHEEASKFLGISIKEEKDIVAIVTSKESKTAIMQSINKAVGIMTEGKAVLMSLPVDTMVGIGRGE